MSAIPRIISIQVVRNAAPANPLSVFVANPVTFRVYLDSSRPTATGLDSITAEIRRGLVDETTPLASVTIDGPTGAGPFDVEFTGAQMNQALDGKKKADFWLVIYGVSGDDDELDILHTGPLVITEHSASLTAPSPPNPSVALSRSAADLLYATLTSLATETSTRGAADTALDGRIDTLETGTFSVNVTTSAAFKLGSQTALKYDTVNDYASGFGAHTTGQTFGLGMGPRVFEASAGGYNTAFGYNAAFTSPGDYNTAVGFQAIFNGAADYSTGVGYHALYLTAGDWNTALGAVSMQAAAGTANTAIGFASRYTSPGSYNVAVGYDNSLNQPGDRNTSAGYAALGGSLAVALAGDDNAAFGHFAHHLTPGSGNTAIGRAAAYNITGGVNTTVFLGKDTTTLAGTTTSVFIGNGANSNFAAANSMALGAGAQVTKSNQVVIGNASVTETLIRGPVFTTSIPEHADNAAAVTAGLAVGTPYRTGDFLKIVH